jgi:regulator of protease activity HflC (stomatin/prohibitin superfamily)
MEKKKAQITLGVIVLLIFIIFISTKRIDAGHAGIKVYNYGDDKGVSNIVEVTGWTLYNPLSQKVYEVPTYVQTANYKLDTVEIDKNTELRFNTKDGMVVRIDASLNYSTPSESVVKIFRKYRKPVTQLEGNVLRNLVIESLNQVCGDYTCEQVYEKRNELETKARKHLKDFLGKEGFIVEQFVILGELRLPRTVVHNINEKVNATQIALKKQQEVQQEFFESLKRITKARGDSSVAMISATGKANALLVTADAEAKSNNKISSSITDVLIRYNQSNNWDGHYPATLVTNGQNVILPLSNK